MSVREREREEALTLERLHSHPVVCFYVLVYLNKQGCVTLCMYINRHLRCFAVLNEVV